MFLTLLVMPNTLLQTCGSEMRLTGSGSDPCEEKKNRIATLKKANPCPENDCWKKSNI